MGPVLCLQGGASRLTQHWSYYLPLDERKVNVKVQPNSTEEVVLADRSVEKAPLGRTGFSVSRKSALERVRWGAPHSTVMR